MFLTNTILNIIILVNITLIAGVLPLIERKYLSLIQRRVGPTFVGYKGRLQFIADALKMFLKGCLIPYKVNGFYFLFYPSIVLAICYLFWLYTYWGFNLSYFEVEHNIIYIGILSILINFSIILTGFHTKNKYATMAAIRSIAMLFCLELLMGLMFLNIYIHNGSFNFTLAMVLQKEYPYFTLFFCVYSIFLVVVLMEINRSPFDTTEAESELIAGYHIEYGGFFFGLFYLGEYMHLFFFSIIIIILCFGL